MDELSAYMRTNLGPAAVWTRSNAQRYSTIIRTFLSGVGCNVLRATLEEAASKAGCSIQSFLYKNQTKIKYVLSEHKLSREFCLLYPPDDTDVDIQRWNCRLLCLVLRATNCLDTRGHDDVCLIERMYRRHCEEECCVVTLRKPVLASSKQQPKPKREWIRTCAAIQRLVENTGETSLLSSVRNFICKVEMGGKTMDARIETHISLAKMITELAASHTKGSSKEDQALRKHIGELTKLHHQYDAVSKPTFSTSRSSKNLSRTMVAEGNKMQSFFRPSSATTINSITHLGQTEANPSLRSDIIDPTKTGNGTAKKNRPFSNTSLGSDRFRSASLVTPKLSHSRTDKQPEEKMPDNERSWEDVAQSPTVNSLKDKQQVNLDSENNNVLFRSKDVPDSNEKQSYTRDAQVVFACPKVLERSGSSKINKTVRRPHSFDVAEGNKSLSRHGADVSNHRNSRHLQNGITSRHHQHGRHENNFSPIRPNSFDVSRMSRPLAKRPSVVNNDLSLTNGSYEEWPKASIKERHSNITQIYSQSLTIKPSNHDKQNHVEKPPFSSRSHLQQTIHEKQQDAKLIVSQPAFSSLLAYTSKYHRHQKQNKETHDTDQNNATEENTKIEIDQPEIVSDPNEEEEQADITEEPEPSIQEEPVIDTPQEQPVQSRSRFGRFKAMLKNAIKVKRSVDTTELLDDDSKKTGSKGTMSDKVTSVDENETGDTTNDTPLRGQTNDASLNDVSGRDILPLSEIDSVNTNYEAKSENIMEPNKMQETTDKTNLVEPIGDSPDPQDDKTLPNDQHSTSINQEDIANDSFIKDEKVATVQKNDNTGELKKKNAKVHFLPSSKVKYKSKKEKKRRDPLPDAVSQGKEEQLIDDIQKNGDDDGTSKSVTIMSTKEQLAESKDKTNKKLGIKDDRDHVKPNILKENVNLKTIEVEEDNNSLDDTVEILLPNLITKVPDVPVSESNNQTDTSTSLPMEDTKTTAKDSSATHETENQKTTFAPKQTYKESGLPINSIKTKDFKSENIDLNPESKEDVQEEQTITTENETVTLISKKKGVAKRGFKKDSSKPKETPAKPTRKPESTKQVLNKGKGKGDIAKNGIVLMESPDVDSTIQQSPKVEVSHTLEDPESQLNANTFHLETFTTEKPVSTTSSMQKSGQFDQINKKSEVSKRFQNEKSDSELELNPAASKEIKAKKGKPVQKSKKAISKSSNKKSPNKKDKQSDKVVLLDSVDVYEEDSDKNESITFSKDNVDKANDNEKNHIDSDEAKIAVTKDSDKALEIPTLKNDKAKIPDEENILGIEEDPDADMKRIANDVIVHNQVHKAAREFMEKDKAFADDFFSFLHRHKATKEFLRTEQFSPFKTMKLSNGAKAALSFLHAFTFRHVNVFDREYCNHVVEKILKKTECEDARMAKEKEDKIISNVKAEVKTRKRTPFHNTRLITKDTVETMRNKRMHQNRKSTHKEDKTNQLGDATSKREDAGDNRPISALKRLHNIAECRCWKCRHKDLAMTIAVNWRNHDLCRLYLLYGVKFKMEHLLPAVRANDADNVKEIVGYLKRRFEWDEENEDVRMALILARFHNMTDIVGYLEMEGVQDERVVQCACFA